QREAQRLAAAEAARRASERRAAEEAARLAAERKAAEARAAEEAAQREARRLAAEEAARRDAARRAEDEAAHRRAAERQAAEEAASRAAARRAADDAAQLERERRAVAEALRQEEQELRIIEQAINRENQRQAVEAARRQAPAPLTHAPVKSPQQTVVMVADDSRVVRVKTGRLLSAHDYQVLTAEDGLDAARQIEGTVPDILVTDVDMPGLDGFQLSRQVRADPRTAHVPIIMVTSDNDELRSQAAAVGVNVVLGKPYPEELLINHIERLMMAQAGR
ncbi:response regulator, partial [Accumulibacter sp.]